MRIVLQGKQSTFENPQSCLLLTYCEWIIFLLKCHSCHIMFRLLRSEVSFIAESIDIESDQFFCFYDTSSATNSVSAELDMYLNDTSHDINSLNKFPLVRKVFIEKNTALPSSAPVERLFSLGGQILTPRRNGLTDDHFEMLVLICANKKLNDN